MPENQNQEEQNPLVALRGQVINPTPSAQVQTLQNRVGAGSAALPTYQSIGTGGTFNPVAAPTAEPQAIAAGNPLVSSFQGPAADVTSLRGTLNTQAQGLSSAPNRAQLAADAFELMRQRSDPAYQQRLRQVGQKAAALGRIGAGQTTNELGDVATLYNRGLQQAQTELSLNAAQQELQDRLGVFSALGGLQSQLFGQDLGLDSARLNRELAQSGERRGLRDEARSERGQLFDFGQQVRGEQRLERGQQFDAGLSNREEARRERSSAEEAALRRYGLDAGALGQLESLERGRRDETRGERERADVLAEIANRRRIEQIQQEAALQQQLFDQFLRRAGLAGTYGFGGTNILDAVGGFSGTAERQGQGFTEAGQQALMNYFLNQARQGQGGGGGTVVYPGEDPIDLYGTGGS